MWFENDPPRVWMLTLMPDILVRVPNTLRYQRCLELFFWFRLWSPNLCCLCHCQCLCQDILCPQTLRNWTSNEYHSKGMHTAVSVPGPGETQTRDGFCSVKYQDTWMDFIFMNQPQWSSLSPSPYIVVQPLSFRPAGYRVCFQRSSSLNWSYFKLSTIRCSCDKNPFTLPTVPGYPGSTQSHVSTYY